MPSANGNSTMPQPSHPRSEIPALPLPLPQAWRAVIALCIGFFMILLDQTIVAVATPAIQRDLHAGYDELIWVTSAYLLAFAVPLLVTGRLGDRVGPRTMYVTGMGIFTLASLLCGLAPNIEVLIAARVLQGLGAAMLTPQTMSVINRVFPREKRGAAMGLWGATAGISTLTGPVLGGLVTSAASWHWVFYTNVPIGVLSIAMVLRWVPQLPRTTKPIDGLSVVLSLVFMTALIVAIQEVEQLGWIWSGILALAAIVLLVVFIRRQRTLTDTDPLIPLELFAIRQFSWGNVAIFAQGFAVAGMMIPTMMYLQVTHRLEPLPAALLMIPMSLLSALLSPLVGRAVDRHEPHRFAFAGFVFMALGNLGLVVAMRDSLSEWWIIVPMLILGIGNPLVWAPNSTATLRDLPGRYAGAGSGMYNLTRQIGSVTGTAAVGSVLQTRIISDPGSAFGYSMIPAVAVLVLGMWAAYCGGRAPQEALTA